MPSKFSKRSSGFTLIELLVGITIISVLSMVGLVSYNGFIKDSKDKKRQADLKVVQSVLENYHGDLLVYPVDETVGSVVGFNSVLQEGGLFNSDTGRGGVRAPASSKTYMNALPKDPKPTTPYCYKTMPETCTNSSTSKCTSYRLYAQLDSLPPGGTTYSCGTLDYNFEMTPP